MLLPELCEGSSRGKLQESGALTPRNSKSLVHTEFRLILVTLGAREEEQQPSSEPHGRLIYAVARALHPCAPPVRSTCANNSATTARPVSTIPARKHAQTRGSEKAWWDMRDPAATRAAIASLSSGIALSGESSQLAAAA
jgi:hypothetical protein